MVWYANADDDEPNSFISFVPIYNSSQHSHDHDDDLCKNPNILFDFQIVYNRVFEPDSDGEEYFDFDNFEIRTICQTHEFDKNWLIGGDKSQIQAIVYHILDLVEVPYYREIVTTLTWEILGLKMRDMISDLPKVERIQVELNVIVCSFPGDDDVKLAVAPACDEAVEKHLETVVVRNEGYCVICMDKIRVGSDMAAGRMPCMHVFHRTCGENWLRNSGICPLCRAVFPS